MKRDIREKQILIKMGKELETISESNGLYSLSDTKKSSIDDETIVNNIPF